MKALLPILLALFSFQPILAEEVSNVEEDVFLPVSPMQKVYSRYQKDFAYRHDRGFYFATALGPQWNQSLQSPKAKAVRFGGKISAGWFVAHGFSLFASAWGDFLEEASLIAGGPGFAFLFDGPNLGIDFSLGIGRAFNALKSNEIIAFGETVLSANLGIAKYWWLSGRNSFGLSLNSSIHGLTVANGSVNNFGWSLGLGAALLFG